MSKYVVTAVIVVNNGDGLVQCLDSVITQDYRPLQLAVLGQNTLKLPPELMGKKLQMTNDGVAFNNSQYNGVNATSFIFANTPTAGKQKNRAIKELAYNSDFFLFMDEDSRLHRSCVSKLVKTHQENQPHVAATYGNFSIRGTPQYLQPFDRLKLLSFEQHYFGPVLIGKDRFNTVSFQEELQHFDVYNLLCQISGTALMQHVPENLSNTIKSPVEYHTRGLDKDIQIVRKLNEGQ